MKKLLTALVALAFLGATVPTFAAEPSGAAPSGGDTAAAPKDETGAPKKTTKKTAKKKKTAAKKGEKTDKTGAEKTPAPETK